MPKLSDAINKVNQDEAQRKKPVKRRPYLDNITAKMVSEDILFEKPKPKTILATEPVEEILQAQITANKINVPVTEVGEGTAPLPKIPSQSLKEKEISVTIPTFKLEEETPKPKPLPIIDKKLKPLNDLFDGSEFEIPIPKPPTPPYKPVPNVINNSHANVNPKGTLGTDEEDGVDLSLYNLEEFGATTKAVMLYIFRKAKENKCLVTPPIKKNDLLKECGLNLNTIKSVLQRLCHYKFIKLEKYQRGPFGWTRYSIRESLYNQLLYNYDALNTGLKFGRPGVMPTENNSFGVGEEITIPDTLKEIGFNMGHVNQLKKMPMSLDIIQNSLDAFAFDIQDKEFKLKIRSPLAVFMKVAKTEGEYISSRGYVSPENEIMQQMIQLKKDRALHAKKQQDELLNLSFVEWLQGKTREEIIKLVPPSGDYLGSIHKAELKNWFQENIHQK